MRGVELGAPRLWRTGGYALGGTLHGRFRRGGRRLFLWFEDAAKVVQLELRASGPGDVGGPQADLIVVGVSDPRATAARIRANCRLID